MTKNILALKIELYVPETMPINSAKVNERMEPPANNTSEESVTTTVNDVFSERAMVCSKLALTI